MNLNSKEEKTYNIIKNIVNGDITRKEAMFELKKSRQQIYRLINLYYSEGKEGFIHKNRGKSNSNKKDNKLIEELETLYLKEYNDYNFEHFYEDVVFGIYDISYDTMLKYFTKDDIISPLAHKETIKEYNEKMKRIIKDNDNNLKEEKIQLFKSRMIAVEKAHIRRPNNLFVFGQEVQMDACQKLWFGNMASYLHLAVDTLGDSLVGSPNEGTSPAVLLREI